jgi:hypothetical protein
MSPPALQGTHMGSSITCFIFRTESEREFKLLLSAHPYSPTKSVASEPVRTVRVFIYLHRIYAVLPRLAGHCASVGLDVDGEATGDLILRSGSPIGWSKKSNFSKVPYSRELCVISIGRANEELVMSSQ